MFHVPTNNYVLFLAQSDFTIRLSLSLVIIISVLSYADQLESAQKRILRLAQQTSQRQLKIRTISMYDQDLIMWKPE